MSARIIIEKAPRRLTLYREDGTPLVMPVALGSHPVGQKEREGDGRTPEGVYYVCTRNGQSRYHLSLGLSYPGEADAARGLREGVITPAEAEVIVSAQRRRVRPPWDTALGGFIMIHGGGTEGDWTAGCVALSDRDMDILWENVPLGTEVEIRP